MSTLTLDRPTSTRTDLLEATRPEHSSATVGSYVDTDGVRRAPQRLGSYTGQPVASLGSYVDTDGVRRTRRQGTYTSTER